MTTIPEVTLFTRAGCHLCDDALKIIQQCGVDPRVIDIDSDRVLQERFNTCVPVVEVDGKIRFRGKVHPALFRRLIESK
jgi:glutaredoxin